MSDVHVARHDVAFAQFNPLAHGVAAPGEHVPEPLQVFGVSCPSTHEGAPHETLVLGYWHAPAASQLDVPHTPVAHAALQQ